MQDRKLESTLALMSTNRDLYALVEEHWGRAHNRTLENYLKTMWHLALPHASLDVLPFDTFVDILGASFIHAPPAVVPKYMGDPSKDMLSLTGYALWECTILVQIQDLHEMANSGALANEYRYFGIDSPRGARWYNFDPKIFTETGISCAIDGYTPDDRDPVVELGASNEVDLELLRFDIESLPWDVLASFLWFGQSYE